LLEGCLIVESVTQPKRLLVASGPFGPRLSASAVAAAIARGIEEAGLPEPDICLLPLPAQDGEDARTLLDGLSFDARMRRSRAVVVAADRLEEQMLAGSVTFEIATRARQAGVPAYAVTAENRLDRFDARILDLQVILQARDARALAAAGRELAQVV
jgi:glycerate kinase